MPKPRPAPLTVTTALASTLVEQLDLFPFKPVIETLDPKRVVGPRTAVEDVVRVRLRPNDAPHIVFHDRHGWYCETHGSECVAVRLAQTKGLARE